MSTDKFNFLNIDWFIFENPNTAMMFDKNTDTCHLLTDEEKNIKFEINGPIDVPITIDSEFYDQLVLEKNEITLYELLTAIFKYYNSTLSKEFFEKLKDEDGYSTNHRVQELMALFSDKNQPKTKKIALMMYPGNYSRFPSTDLKTRRHLFSCSGLVRFEGISTDDRKFVLCLGS